MAEITKSGWPSPVSLNAGPDRYVALPGATAGEPMMPGDSFYVGTDGNLHLTDASGAAASATTRFRGQVAQMAGTGEAVTWGRGLIFQYPGVAATAVGTDLYLSLTTKGGYSTTAPYAGAPPVGWVCAPGIIEFFFNK